MSGGTSSADLSLIPINGKDDVLVVSNNCEGGNIWQLDKSKNMDSEQVDKPVKIHFTLKYKEISLVEDGDQRGNIPVPELPKSVQSQG